jgi:beta-lactamase class A
LAQAAAPKSLVAEWQRIASTIDGTVGASMLDLQTGNRVSLHGADCFPLASVCKLPLAMNILSLVEERKLTLDDEIEVLPSDIIPWTSPIGARWPAQRRFSLRELTGVMLTASDNTAVQALYRIGGGAPAMAARFRQWRIDGIRIDRSEGRAFLDAGGAENLPLEEKWTVAIYDSIDRLAPAARLAAMRRFIADPRDTGTPDATVDLLVRAYRGELLSKSATGLLFNWMRASTPGAHRLKGLLQPGTVVAHKTGTADTVQGLNGATNDAGIIEIADGRRLAIAVYVKGSTASLAAREGVIAQIARAAFDRTQIAR